jgi:hypothetical protein
MRRHLIAIRTRQRCNNLNICNVICESKFCTISHSCLSFGAGFRIHGRTEVNN